MARGPDPLPGSPEIEANRSAGSLRFLLEAGRLLATSLSYEQTLERVTRLSVPRIADLCAVDVLEHGRLVRVGVAHADPGRAGLAARLEERHPGDPSASRDVQRVLATGEPLFLPEIPDAFLRERALDDEHYALLRELELRSGILVPLVSRERTLGVLTLFRSAARPPFEEEDVEVAVELGHRAASALHNAELYTEAKEELAQRERAEAELRELAEELEERVARRTVQLQSANEELEAFSYSVSHDLRAPLRAVHGFARILAEDFADDLPDEAREFLELIQGSARQMGQLIDDLLAFSRLNRQRVKRQRVDVRGLVEGILEELAPDLEGREVDVRIGPLPEAFADRALLKQLLANLLANAVKFTRDREDARIEIAGEEREGERHYVVRDNGAGFDMRFVEKLFGVFQRLHLAEEYEGTGVGLAIVKRVATRHGGRVWAEGRVGEGAAFHFTLPLPEHPEHPEEEEDDDG